MDDPPWLTAVLTEVDAAYAGAGAPVWPDPHPDLASPAEEEYSRYSHPERTHAVLTTRLTVWIDTLAPYAGLRTPARMRWHDERGGRTAATRVLAPHRAGTLALALRPTTVEGAPFGYDVGVLDDGMPVLLASLPVCGCDACDDGSAYLLGELDDVLVTVVRGGAVHARRAADRVTRTRDGWSSSGAAGRSWLSDPPTGVRRWAGEPWA